MTSQGEYQRLMRRLLQWGRYLAPGATPAGWNLPRASEWGEGQWQSGRPCPVHPASSESGSLKRGGLRASGPQATFGDLKAKALSLQRV